MSYRKIFIAVFTLCCVLPAITLADAYGNRHQVNISGATLFQAFFTSPASTNDHIDADGDGLYLFDPYNSSLPDQLAWSDWISENMDNRWLVQYRGVGSGNGLKELDLFNNTAPAVGDGNFAYPSDVGTINRTVYCTLGVLNGNGNPDNPGGSPYPPERVDMAVMDVPTFWFVQAGSQADAYWDANPADTANGYGKCPITSWDKKASNKLKTLTNLTLADICDVQVAWVPIAIIANQGTGLRNVTQEDLQHLFLAGRMAGGENLYAATRDAGSGTRNGGMNSLGLDPSWGRGDNMGSKSADAEITQVGPKHQQTNLDGSGIMEDAVLNQRLSVGYTGLVGSSRAIGDATGGKYEILNVKKTGATQYLRPSKNSIVDTLDPNTGWQIGGNETFAYAPTAISQYGLDYLNNIRTSIAEFTDPCGVGDQNNMPGQYLAANFSLAAALTALPSDADPSIFVSNAGYVPALNAYFKAVGPIVPAYGIVPAGKVPNRFNGPTYSDGTNGGNYKYSDGLTTPAEGSNLTARNQIMGDFNYDLKRDITDINKMLEAIWHPRSFEAGATSGQGVCPEIIGDFTADGNFTTEDIRYFADGLAVYDTGNGKKLDRSAGFAMVDQFWTADRADINHPTAGNFFNTAVVGGRDYQAGSGWSKADVAKSNWDTNVPTIGYLPSADGKIDANDIDYIYWILRGGLEAKYFGLTLTENCTAWQNVMHWSNLDEAAFMDLSCDLNGDLIIDFADVRIIVQDILGTQFGDADLDGEVDADDEAVITAHLGQAGGWNEGDMNGDGMVTACDFDFAGGSGISSPDLDGDGDVDFADFAIFANSWLQGV